MVLVSSKRSFRELVKGHVGALVSALGSRPIGFRVSTALSNIFFNSDNFCFFHRSEFYPGKVGGVFDHGGNVGGNMAESCQDSNIYDNVDSLRRFQMSNYQTMGHYGYLTIYVKGFSSISYYSPTN